MTENDVESLMGCSGKRRFSHELPDEYQKTWGNGDCGNVVVFDENGKVSRFLVMKNSSTHLVDANESFYEKLCQLLGIKTRERL